MLNIHYILFCSKLRFRSNKLHGWEFSLFYGTPITVFLCSASPSYSGRCVQSSIPLIYSLVTYSQRSYLFTVELHIPSIYLLLIHSLVTYSHRGYLFTAYLHIHSVVTYSQFSYTVTAYLLIHSLVTQSQRSYLFIV